ncbi:MAG: hypothetical protein ACOH5I_16540 [Oligoflexus sp.]
MLRRKTSIIAVVTSGLSLSSCQNHQLQGSGSSSKVSKDEAPVTDVSSVDHDQVIPPNNISGSYLTCSFEKEPTEEVPESLVGCRFDDANGQRVPATSLGISYQFSYTPPPQSSITVYVRELIGDSRYDAVYLFFGIDRESLLQEARQTTIHVSVEGENVTGQDVVISNPLSSIERNVNTIPELPNNDYNDVREDILVDAQNGEVTPPF